MASPGGPDGAPKGDDLQPSSSSSTSSSSRDSSTTMGSNGSTEPTSLTIQNLREITDNFSEERVLGQGAYGKVYKGMHKNEEIAVKRLHNNMQDLNDEQFKHEFDNLMMLNHPNVVRLVAYCYETQRRHTYFQGSIVFGEETYRALCLEYMPNGSLQRHLSDEFHGLDWKTRYNIIKGTCEGLKYLHEGLKEPIYHLDLKPDNILLDGNMTPKLADFGLSKLFGEEQTRVTDGPAGTFGYMPPEYILRQVVSNKFDVFSLGVVITKIIAGPGGHTRSADMPHQEFLDQVYENWRKRLEPTFTSSRILEAYCKQVRACTEIGLKSMEQDRHTRPSIVDIIDILDVTETMVEEAISFSANSCSSVPVESQMENGCDLVKVEAFARNKAIQVTETCDDFPVLVRVTGAPWRHAEEMPRAGVDVVFTLNVWMEEVKEAAMMLIDRLSPNDRLSILFPQAHMQHVMELTYMSHHGRDVASLKISELAHSHAHEEHRYLGSALPEAAQILRQRGVEDSSRMGCIMHMHTWINSVQKQDMSQEFPVHTIAIGHHRLSAQYLKQVADITSGTYSFIQDNGKQMNNMKYAVALIIARITSVAARSVRITLEADEDVTISSIGSGRYGNLVSSDKRSGAIEVPYMCAGEVKNFIVYLTVPQGKEKLMTVGGGYQSLNTSEEIAGIGVVVLRPHRQCLPDELVIQPKVAAELLRIQLIKEISAEANDVGPNKPPTLWDRIKVSNEARGFTEETLEEVSVMDGPYEVHDMDVFSWLSCHEWQRATVKGEPSNSCAFQTTGQQQAVVLETKHVGACTDLVKVEGFTRSKAIMCTENCNNFPVLVRLTAAPWLHANNNMSCARVDIVAVLDVSRNMQGERLEQMKEAMMVVIDKLGPNDRLSIVSFHTHTSHLMELIYMSDDQSYARDVARLKVSELKASKEGAMGHNARAALLEGAQILRWREPEESSCRLGCTMLLSDGEYPEVLRANINPEFPVHTFGLGIGHNPKVLNYIANKTSGTYSFLKDMSNMKDALALFVAGLHLPSVAVPPVQIILRPHFGITISSIESGPCIHKVESDQMSGTINIDRIYAAERKEFVVNLTVGNGRKELMTIECQYKSLNQSKSLPEVKISVLRPWGTNSPEELAIHCDVAAVLARIRLQNGILAMFEKQQLSGQSLQKLWDVIKDSDEGRGMLEDTLYGLSKDVAEMKRDISGLAYTLSWLSYQKWQPASSIRQRLDGDSNSVKLETFTRSNAIPGNETCHEFPVLVRVSMAPCQHVENMPHISLDVVALLDVSVTMEGEKLERLKQAMLVVIEKLGADDRLSIVSFNTYENRLTKLTYMSDYGREVARLKIHKLVASGQKNMGAALLEGYQILCWRGAECISRLGCMILLSDGEYPEIFKTELNPEFPVHTFGLGTDHNPNNMKYIADVSSGTYSFINQDIDMIEDALVLFITGLTSVDAMSIKITFRTGEGITISSIESGGYINHVKSDDRSGTIDIYSICAGEQKDFIIYLRVAEGRKELMTIGGRYLGHDTVKHLAYTDVDVQRPHQECLPVDLAIQPNVAAELVRIRLKKGISAMMEQSLSSTDQLQQLWDGIVGSEEGRGAPEEILSGLSMDITEMKKHIEHPEDYRKSGLPYTLSWLSSHNWQRATIKGSPYKSSDFQTIKLQDNGNNNFVKVKAFTGRSAIPGNIKCNDFPVLVRVTVVPQQHVEEMPRAGVDVIAVLDVSGRMEGRKLELMKQAMLVVIGKLSVADRLSIVSFNTYEHCLTKLTYMSDHGRDVARFKVDKLVAGGQNNMVSALREGAQILLWRGEESNRRVGSMILMSDGQYPEIFRAGISPEFPVHTFGLGTNHNPKVMKYIADMTSGTYSFINQDIDMIKEAFALFVASITSITAMSVKITLRTEEGMTISSIESGGYVNHVKSNDMSGIIDIKNICPCEPKDFIVYLRVAEYKKKLMTIGGQYISNNKVKYMAKTDVYLVRPHQECVPGDFAIHPEVAEELVRIGLEKGVSAMLKKGLSLDRMNQICYGIDRSEYCRGASKETFSRLGMDITEMLKGIEHPEEYYKSGLPYTLSWLSSQKWQCATIKGTAHFSNDSGGSR